MLHACIELVGEWLEPITSSFSYTYLPGNDVCWPCDCLSLTTREIARVATAHSGGVNSSDRHISAISQEKAVGQAVRMRESFFFWWWW